MCVFLGDGSKTDSKFALRVAGCALLIQITSIDTVFWCSRRFCSPTQVPGTIEAFKAGSQLNSYLDNPGRGILEEVAQLEDEHLSL